jgi:hypothetical protein
MSPIAIQREGGTMKLSTSVAFVLTIAMLFAASSALGQGTNPKSLSFEAVPPNISPAENLAFFNDGAIQLTVSVSVSGPFTITENRCGNGVKPGTHCNLFFTYTPQAVRETDNGALTINYGGGITTVPLIGRGVASISTSAQLGPAPFQCLKVHLGNSIRMSGLVGVDDKFYALPTGESVSFSCTDGEETLDLGAQTLVLSQGHRNGRLHDLAGASFTPDQLGQWSCTMTYDGDGILGATSAAVIFEVSEKYANRRCGP